MYWCAKVRLTVIGQFSLLVIKRKLDLVQSEAYFSNKCYSLTLYLLVIPVKKFRSN